MLVVYAETGEESLDTILEFLRIRWTGKEIEDFLADVDNLIENLTAGKFEMYQKYSRDVRSALIGKRHIRVYFRQDNSQIIRLLYFFDMRDDPEKLRLFIK